MQTFHVDPDGMRSSGEGIQRSVGEIDDALTAFENELAGYGEPWGADDLGSMIGLVYTAIRDIAFECLDANLEDMHLYGGNVTVMADNFAAAEDGNAAGFQGIQQELG
ncbi:WXG100 family type VII secretion target [Catenuloplanes atrovinosus]|uniref:Uncharacterized protein n=1 Tax=Catenuloplanes atrovinosus TaxID=137266 RepID=A0AAE3YV77_9ACTN|nr:hypothetical protein [Catenuloplanes atrovinosus]MDR7278988.1 hypothetical protein [Catenuloplanes atrovinosus]